jgi:hypothetical protein
LFPDEDDQEGILPIFEVVLPEDDLVERVASGHAEVVLCRTLRRDPDRLPARRGAGNEEIHLVVIVDSGFGGRPAGDLLDHELSERHDRPPGVRTAPE